MNQYDNYQSNHKISKNVKKDFVNCKIKMGLRL